MGTAAPKATRTRFIECGRGNIKTSDDSSQCGYVSMVFVLLKITLAVGARLVARTSLSNGRCRGRRSQ